MWENHNRVQVGRVSSMLMLTSRIWYQIPCTKLRMEINKSRNDSTIQSKTLFKFLVQLTLVSARKVEGGNETNASCQYSIILVLCADSFC